MLLNNSVGELELARRWLAGRLATSFTTNAEANQPRLLAIWASDFMAYLATIGADPVATHDDCERQGWIGAFTLVYQLRALGPGDPPGRALRLPSVMDLGGSTTTAAHLLRTAPAALLVALAGLGEVLGRHRVVVVTEGVFDRTAATGRTAPPPPSPTEPDGPFDTRRDGERVFGLRVNGDETEFASDEEAVFNAIVAMWPADPSSPPRPIDGPGGLIEALGTGAGEKRWAYNLAHKSRTPCRRAGLGCHLATDHSRAPTAMMWVPFGGISGNARDEEMA